MNRRSFLQSLALGISALAAPQILVGRSSDRTRWRSRPESGVLEPDPGMLVPNPAWVNAEYEVAFFVQPGQAGRQMVQPITFKRFTPRPEKLPGFPDLVQLNNAYPPRLNADGEVVNPFMYARTRN